MDINEQDKEDLEFHLFKYCLEESKEYNADILSFGNEKMYYEILDSFDNKLCDSVIYDLVDFGIAFLQKNSISFDMIKFENYMCKIKQFII